MEEKALKEEIIALGKRLYDLRLVAARGGNLSSRIDNKKILITATSTCLGELKAEDIIRVDLAQKKEEQKKRLSSEYPLHKEVYQSFSKVSRIIHCHPPLTNAYFSVYNNLEVITFEAKISLGNVPVVEQSTPTITNTQEVIEGLKANNIVVIKNHGVVAVGNNFKDALFLIESLEEAVRIAGVARLFKKEGLNEFERELKHELSKPRSKSIYEMFSPDHIEAIVDLVNKDEFIAKKGAELDLTVEIAIKLQEKESKVYKLCFKKGKILKVESKEDAPFLISASKETWRLVFSGKLDPFVAVNQGKMKIKGELGKLSRWYVPFNRVFELFQAVEIR